MKSKKFQWDRHLASMHARARARLSLMHRSRRLSTILGLTAWLVMAVVFARLAWRSPRMTQTAARLSKIRIAESLAPLLKSNQFPEQVEVALPRQNVKALARYTMDPVHQIKIEKLVAQYRPDYAAFVAIDAETGRVLVMVSYSRAKTEQENLALKATFPAASIFKIVTAAAAIDQGVMSVDTVIPFNGSNHTLYRRNVTDQRMNRWTRQMTLREAFAKSVNTVFGKIGMYVLEPFQLQDYAERFQFNKPIVSDIPIETGQVRLPEAEAWGFAELASGFNRVSSMSPLQGALIAAAVANDGVMMEPFVVEDLSLSDGTVLYEANPVPTSVTMKAETAAELRTLMRETVVSGTSRSAFRSLMKRPRYRELEIGGKTGSLRGIAPKGKCDWFVGYVRSPERRIAMAALTVNEDKWRVKASYLARVFVEEYFKRR